VGSQRLEQATETSGNEGKKNESSVKAPYRGRKKTSWQTWKITNQTNTKIWATKNASVLKLTISRSEDKSSANGGGKKRADKKVLKGKMVRVFH